MGSRWAQSGLYRLSEKSAPGMLSRRRLRVHPEEVVQDMQEGQDVLLVAAMLRFPNVIDNHVTDFLGAVLCGKKIARKSGRGDFRDVLVFGDGEHFLLGQAAQSDAILQSDHGALP
jgi:hypothetical protein